MTKLTWTAPDDLVADVGVDRGVLYPPGKIGIPWNGLVKVEEHESTRDYKTILVDGTPITSRNLPGSFSAKVEALSYPDILERPIESRRLATQQKRGSFNFSYRTGRADGSYEIHLIFNALFTPTKSTYSTGDDSMDMALFSWEMSTSPYWWYTKYPSAHYIIDSGERTSEFMTQLESYLYGTEDLAPSFPSIAEIETMADQFSLFQVLPNSATRDAVIIGTDEQVRYLGNDVWEITEETVEQVDDHIWVMKSW